ncbi:hypothetical protein HJ536_16075 [Donghicola sp. B5-SW-15]|uniref:Uncharacterized protein n=1 Tax=Donghicola mangrovi TaxID=2729614 RepID=A0A850Q7H8_9RHOB|nr:hypothetical protein [Donghicola mangrovi]NVO24874.1 hypothetical protein [Donghicola mangrovi]
MPHVIHPPLLPQNIVRSIRAQVPRKALRDLKNRTHFGEAAPLSDECIYIDPRAITHRYVAHPRKGAPNFRRTDSGRIMTGDWDRSTAPLTLNIKDEAIRQHFLMGVPWEQTALFAKLSRDIAEKGIADDCHSVDDLRARYERMDRLFEEAARTRSLRPRNALPDYFRREHGGIFVHIDRDGRAIRSGGGMHRFAIARLLGLTEVPAQIGVVHFDAVRNGLLTAYRRQA